MQNFIHIHASCPRVVLQSTQDDDEDDDDENNGDGDKSSLSSKLCWESLSPVCFLPYSILTRVEGSRGHHKHVFPDI